MILYYSIEKPLRMKYFTTPESLLHCNIFMKSCKIRYGLGLFLEAHSPRDVQRDAEVFYPTNQNYGYQFWS